MVLLAGFALFGGSPALAQSLRVGVVKSERECTIYEQSAGASGAVVTRNAIGVFSSWRTWLVRDCVDNFPSLRNSIEAALASRPSIGRNDGALTVNARLSQVSGGDVSPDDAPASRRAGGYAIASDRISVGVDVTVLDRAGRVVFGNVLTTSVEIASSVTADGVSANSEASGRGRYARLQQAVALAIARSVAFRLDPLRVTDDGPGNIRLNYGVPLLPFGASVDVAGPDGPTRYRVISSFPGSAVAEPDRGGSGAVVRSGDIATMIEADNPAASRRRYGRVELP